MVNFDLQWLKTAAEFTAMVIFFAFTITETTTYSFSMYRSCLVDFGYNKSDCEMLGTGNTDEYLQQIEAEVQPYANYVLMVQEMITQVAPALLVLFLGPWSDKHGRRPVLILNMIGFCAGGVFAIVVASIENMSSWWFMGASLLIALFGGVTPFLTAIICYISDITTEANRGFRMGIFEAVMTVGTLVGTVSVSYIIDAGGYLTVYIIATACFFVALFYNLFVMVDSKDFNKDKAQSKFNVFSVKNFKEIVTTVFRKKDKNATIMIIVAVIISTVVRFIAHADVSIFYMFLRLKLDWDMEKYTLYRTFRELLRIIVTVGAITLLHKKWKIREAPMIAIASALTFASMLLQAWATEDWHIYLAGVIRSASGVLQPLVRSFLSKLVTPEETGKLFSVTVAVESLVLLGGIPLYTIIYEKTMDTNPGAFNFFTAGLFALLLFMAVLSMLVQKFMIKERVFIEKKSHPEDLSSEKKAMDVEAVSD